jgi:hypothetical protein
MRMLLPLLLVSCTSLFAQNAQKEINEQVWKPFIKSFSEGNTDVFMGVHSKDLVRSGRESKKVLNWDEYYNETKSGNAHRATDKTRLEIGLRFTERINSATQAIDVGVYKTSWFAADGKSGAGYGRFHVVLRKEDGTWKILVDTDSNENRTIGETQFLAAKPME